jgi:hypothetical protein
MSQEFLGRLNAFERSIDIARYESTFGFVVEKALALLRKSIPLEVSDSKSIGPVSSELAKLYSFRRENPNFNESSVAGFSESIESWSQFDGDLVFDYLQFHNGMILKWESAEDCCLVALIVSFP